MKELPNAYKMSELAQQLIEQNLRSKDPILDLGDCGLDGTEDELYKPLEQASHIETLLLANSWHEPGEGLADEKHYSTHNTAESNNFTKVPDHLPPLLKQLRIASAYFYSFLEFDWEGGALNDPHLLKPPVENLARIGELRNLELLDIHEFTGNYPGFLAFIPKLKNLRSLSLTKSYVTDITDLQALTKLEYLKLNEHRVTDFSCLKGLKRLKTLFANRGELTTLSSLSKLQSLEKLILHDNHISDLSGIQSLQNLRFLDISENDLWDLKPLEALPQLQGLHINGNHLDTYCYDSLKKITQLEYMRIGGRFGAKAFAFLQQMPQLKHLVLFDMGIKSLYFARYIKHIQHLNLSYNVIEHLTLDDFPHLHTLEVDGNELRSFTAKNLPQLKKINLSDYTVSDKLKKIQLANLRQLKKLNLEDCNKLREVQIKGVPKLKELNLQHCDSIKDWGFMNQIPSLKKLILDYTNLKTLHLKDVKQVKEISCKYCDIDELTLSGLTNLKKVDFENMWGNERLVLEDLPAITTIDLDSTSTSKLELHRLTALTKLVTTGHSLEDLKISELGQLKELDLNNNELTNLDFLAKVPQLAKLDVGLNYIKDIAGLQYTPGLQELDLGSNEIKNIAPIQHLKKLQKLNLSGNEIKDISALTHLPQLRKLDLSNNYIANLTSLQALTQLEELNLNSNIIKRPTALKYLTKLKLLDLNNNQMSSVVALSTLLELEQLDLSFNRVRKWKGSKEMPQLKYLNLSSNNLQDVSGLVFAPNLQHLQLDNNEDVDLAPVRHCKKLTALNISYCRVEGVHHLHSLKKLTTLHLSIGLNNLKPTLGKLTRLHTIHVPDFGTEAPPLWYIKHQAKGGRIKDFLHYTELPFINQIWQLIASGDEDSRALAIQLAKGQGWPQEHLSDYLNYPLYLPPF